MKVIIRSDGALEKLAQAFGVLDAQAEAALARALRHTGAKAKTQVIRALTKQTGLRRATIVRAVKEDKSGRLTYELATKGGNIRLKYFGAREVRAGVTAKPWGKRQLFPGVWIRGGIWPKRVTLNMGGHAFRRTSNKRLPIEGGRSGLYIPEEMIQGTTLDAFEGVVDRDLVARVHHELGRIIGAAGL
ncbi:MAG: hypothetical protein ACK4MV_16460 [Beijerinckiaceae bacterium]